MNLHLHEMTRSATSQRAHYVDAFSRWWQTYHPCGTPEQLAGPTFDGRHRLFGAEGTDAQSVEEVFAANPLRVWSLIESNGLLEVVPGRLRHNCIGYYITEKPAERLCMRVEV